MLPILSEIPIIIQKSVFYRDKLIFLDSDATIIEKVMLYLQ